MDIYYVQNTTAKKGKIEFHTLSQEDSVETARLHLNGMFTAALNNDLIKENNLIGYNKLKEITSKIVEYILFEKSININLKKLHKHNLYTFYHSLKVAVLSMTLGYNLKFNDMRLFNLGLSALLHDIGKSEISVTILEKPDKLNQKEWKEIKKHTGLGIKHVLDSSLPDEVLDGITEHHEKSDGTGYPNNLTENQISLFGKIIAITDVYDALTSHRVYKQAIDPSEGLKIIEAGAGNHFDKKLVELFINNVITTEDGTFITLIK